MEYLSENIEEIKIGKYPPFRQLQTSKSDHQGAIGFDPYPNQSLKITRKLDVAKSDFRNIFATNRRYQLFRKIRNYTVVKILIQNRNYG